MTREQLKVRPLVDEDLPPKVAEVARGLGLNAVSVHEIGRRGLSDVAQLHFAMAELWGNRVSLSLTP
jgi:hypothetical protein